MRGPCSNPTSANISPDQMYLGFPSTMEMVNVFQASLPTAMYFADFEVLRKSQLQHPTKASLMFQHVGLMRKILESCPSGHLAWTVLKSGFDTMLKVNPNLLPASLIAKKKSDILTWISSGIRVTLSRGGLLGQGQAQEMGQQQQLDSCWNVMTVDATKDVKVEGDEDNMGIDGHGPLPGI